MSLMDQTQRSKDPDPCDADSFPGVHPAHFPHFRLLCALTAAVCQVFALAGAIEAKNLAFPTNYGAGSMKWASGQGWSTAFFVGFGGRRVGLGWTLGFLAHH